MTNADFDVISERITDILGKDKEKYNMEESDKQKAVLSNCMTVQLASYLKQRSLHCR